jgi:hypothetical protein
MNLGFSAVVRLEGTKVNGTCNIYISTQPFPSFFMHLCEHKPLTLPDGKGCVKINIKCSVDLSRLRKTLNSLFTGINKSTQCAQAVGEVTIHSHKK